MMSGHQPHPTFGAEPGPLPEYPLLVLKGAPLSTLIALRRHGPGNRRQLSARTGWKKAALDDALSLLQEIGLVARPGFRRWSITPAGEEVLQRLLGDSAAMPAATPTEEPENGSSAVAEQADRPQSGASQPSPSTKDPENSAAQTTAATERPKNRPAAAGAAAEGPKNRSSMPEKPKNGPSPHDHDHDDGSIHDHDHRQQDHDHSPDAEKSDLPALVRRLATLRPPFDHASQWLTGVSPALVKAWLDYLDALPPGERRDRFRNEAGLLRRKVETGAWPPATANGAGAACPQCGQSQYLRDGVCWLCEGIVRR